MKNFFEKFFAAKIFGMLNVCVMFFAVLSTQCTCVWVHHQPKVPEELQKRENK